jgi:hypothetical protein
VQCSGAWGPFVCTFIPLWHSSHKDEGQARQATIAHACGTKQNIEPARLPCNPTASSLTHNVARASPRGCDTAMCRSCVRNGRSRILTSSELGTAPPPLISNMHCSVCSRPYLLLIRLTRAYVHSFSKAPPARMILFASKLLRLLGKGGSSKAAVHPVWVRSAPLQCASLTSAPRS